VEKKLAVCHPLKDFLAGKGKKTTVVWKKEDKIYVRVKKAVVKI